MSSTSAIKAMQTTLLTGSQEDARCAESKRGTLRTQQAANVERAAAARAEAVQDLKEAREAKGSGQMWGSILLGPVVGTFIGGCIGKMNASDYLDDKADADQLAAQEDMQGAELKKQSVDVDEKLGDGKQGSTETNRFVEALRRDEHEAAMERAAT